jgi:hypothetical protein
MYCPAKYLALIGGVGVCLDQRQNFGFVPKFWSHVLFLHQLQAISAAAETSAK